HFPVAAGATLLGGVPFILCDHRGEDAFDGRAVWLTALHGLILPEQTAVPQQPPHVVFRPLPVAVASTDPPGALAAVRIDVVLARAERLVPLGVEGACDADRAGPVGGHLENAADGVVTARDDLGAAVLVQAEPAREGAGQQGLLFAGGFPLALPGAGQPI